MGENECKTKKVYHPVVNNSVSDLLPYIRLRANNIYSDINSTESDIWHEESEHGSLDIDTPDKSDCDSILSLVSSSEDNIAKIKAMCDDPEVTLDSLKEAIFKLL